MLDYAQCRCTALQTRVVKLPMPRLDCTTPTNLTMLIAHDRCYCFAYSSTTAWHSAPCPVCALCNNIATQLPAVASTLVHSPAIVLCNITATMPKRGRDLLCVTVEQEACAFVTKPQKRKSNHDKNWPVQRMHEVNQN